MRRKASRGAPTLCVRQVGKKLGAAWGKLSDAEKAKYK
tara:strand:+ start:34 stop:147 length:114 start_codon:yes stop_codon:yes gene_type:complete